MIVGFADSVLDSIPVIAGIRRRWYIRRVQQLLESGRPRVHLVVLKGYEKQRSRRIALPASAFTSWQEYTKSARLPSDLLATSSGFYCESTRWTATTLVVPGFSKMCVNG